jgi:hypothetical protein
MPFVAAGPKKIDENGSGKKNRRQFCFWTVVLTTRNTR